MEHLLLKASTVAGTDLGTFTAVISAASIDRERDIVDPAGMVRALQKWVPTGKQIPLAWNHSGAAEDQIGSIDPASAHVRGSDVVVDGWIDQSSEVGAHAWRMVKAKTIGFSFGYLTLDSSPRKGGGRLLKELDVFEVTATPTPMNNDTRVLAWKAVAADEELPSVDEIEAALDAADDAAESDDKAVAPQPTNEPDPDMARMLYAAAAGGYDSFVAALGACMGQDDTPDMTMPKAVAPDETSQTPASKAQDESHAVDPLETKARGRVMEIRTGGLNRTATPKVEEQPTAPPGMSPEELREYSHRQIRQVLTGVKER